MFNFSERSLRRMDGIDGRLIEIALEALKLSPVDFGVPEDGGIRTAKRQEYLYKKGVSKCDGFVNKSYHQSGRALDVFAYVGGSASWEVEHLTTIAAAMLQAASNLGYKLEWGGFFGKTGWDKPHFQLPKDEK